MSITKKDADKIKEFIRQCRWQVDGLVHSLTDKAQVKLADYIDSITEEEKSCDNCKHKWACPSPGICLSNYKDGKEKETPSLWQPKDPFKKPSKETITTDSTATPETAKCAVCMKGGSKPEFGYYICPDCLPKIPGDRTEKPKGEIKKLDEQINMVEYLYEIQLNREKINELIDAVNGG